MRSKSNISIDKDRLEEYNKMKPAAKSALYMTARVGAKMMKWMVKFAFYLPGIVRRLAAKSHEPSTRKK
jgi:hypothetical protein